MTPTDIIPNEFLTNALLVARRQAALPLGLPSKSGIYAARAQGAEIWDVEGKRYIDFIAGIGVLNVGHNHPKIVRAAKAQLDKAIHTCFGVAQYEPYIALAERLNALAPSKSDFKTYFLNSGAEATEHACKIARRLTGRSGLIAFEGAFHGRTLLATALTGKADPYKIGFGPLPGDVFHALYPDETKGVSVQASLASLERLFATSIRPLDVAAIIVEPVQGEGGFIPAPRAFLEGLREICTTYKILLIADEVQTGFARTGKMFAIEHAGVEPDFLICAKSIAGGFPLSAVMGKAALFDALPAGAIGSTFGGNPVSCAAALAVLDVIEEEGLLARAQIIGQKLEARWRGWQANGVGQRIIGSIRRVGAMAALEIIADGDPDRPDGEMAAKIQVLARESGVLFLTAGRAGNVLRTHVPLVISDDLLNEGLDIFEAALERAVA